MHQPDALLFQGIVGILRLLSGGKESEMTIRPEAQRRTPTRSEIDAAIAADLRAQLRPGETIPPRIAVRFLFIENVTSESVPTAEIIYNSSAGSGMVSLPYPF